MATRLKELLVKKGRKFEDHDVFAAFERVNKNILENNNLAKPAYFKRGSLLVVCSSTLIRAELIYNSEFIKQALIKELPGLAIKRIIFSLLK